MASHSRLGLSPDDLLERFPESFGTMVRSPAGLIALAGATLLLLAVGYRLLSSPDEAAEAEVALAQTPDANDEDEADEVAEAPAAIPEGDPEPEAEIEVVQPSAARTRVAPVEPIEEPVAPGADDTPDTDERTIYRALLEQKIRALDILLVSPIATRTRGRRSSAAKVDFDAAEKHCRELVIDGVSQWRLPTAGELQALDGSAMLRGGVYWSSTKGDTFGTSRVVWSTFKDRMSSMASKWRGGRAVCVRFHRPEEGEPG